MVEELRRRSGQDRDKRYSLEDTYRPGNYRSSSSDRATMLPKVSSSCSNAGIGSGGDSSKNSCAFGEESEAENCTLYKYISQEKHENLLRRAALNFLGGALRKSTKRLEELQASHTLKIQESAARMILHNLLLNSWRSQRFRLSALIQDNAQLTISVENLNLQLRVLRHLQATEKDRASVNKSEIRNLKHQICTFQKSLKNTELEMSSVQEELRYSQDDHQKLSAQSEFLEQELRDLTLDKETLTSSVEAEKQRAVQADAKCRRTKAELTNLRKQLKDLSAQTVQWSEQIKFLDGKGAKLQEDSQIREDSVQILKSNFKMLLSQVEKQKQKRCELQRSYERLREAFQIETQKCFSLKTELDSALSTFNSQTVVLEDLEKSLSQIQFNHQRTQLELFGYKLRNVRKRRAWLTVINLITSPANIFKYIVPGKRN